MTNLYKLFVSVFLVLQLAGCSTVPLGSVMQLSKVHMATTPPEAVRVAFITPREMRVREGDLVMTVHMKLSDGSFDEQKKLSLLMDQSVPPENVIRAKRDNEQVHILRLRPEDVALFRQMQNVGIEAKKRGVKGSLEIGFGSTGCIEDSAIGPLRLSAFIKTEELSNYVAVMEHVDIEAMLKSAAPDAKVKQCAK